ncbi:hypothetical protein CDL12_19760 [Handroanthus impetiginosus]|uniref:Uncharacterized protein n=1 Tax=Handroanthus impetiginosus TaxID=429701 RepID=A0A2G9GR26_9LAMI|nr:hypothetical protein CDL12_19760 [Handroanthus impetiginosus]
MKNVLEILEGGSKGGEYGVLECKNQVCAPLSRLDLASKIVQPTTLPLVLSFVGQ